jgi:transaldolase
VERAGARTQRLLWASTGTKNPSYDELTYVEPLIGSQTISTLPRKTIAAFAEHGKATASLDQGFDEASQVMRDLHAAGIDLPQVTRKLLDEGIARFVQSFNDTLQNIAARAMASR